MAAAVAEPLRETPADVVDEILWIFSSVPVLARPIRPWRSMPAASGPSLGRALDFGAVPS
jgi:hypothetical protein